MKASVFGIVLFGVLTFSSAVVLYEEGDLNPNERQYQQYQSYNEYGQVRERRSPQQQNPPPPPQPHRGSVTVTGGHTPGAGSFARGDYNHNLWQGRNGARLDANAYYQRNWGMPGPRQDYGGGVRFSVPFGGR